MVSLAFHLFVVGSYFCSVLLWLQSHTPLLQDCCDLVGFCFLCVFSLHVMLASRQPFGVLMQFEVFLSFGVSCLLAWLGGAIFRLPLGFVVWSFFVCHRQSHLCETFCLCLVSACFAGYQCIFQLLVSCCELPAQSSGSFLEIRIGFFLQVAFTALKQTQFGIPPKFTNLHSVKCSLHKWAQHQGQFVWIWPILKLSNSFVNHFDGHFAYLKTKDFLFGWFALWGMIKVFD